jgi:hypothetical protein
VKGNGIRAETVQLVDQVRVLQDLKVLDADPGLGALRALIESGCLVGAHDNPAEQLEEGSSFRAQSLPLGDEDRVRNPRRAQQIGPIHESVPYGPRIFAPPSGLLPLKGGDLMGQQRGVGKAEDAEG